MSAQSLPGPCCHPGQSDDGTILAPVELYQSLAWGVCPKNEWLVRVTTSYYDLLHPSSGNIETTMVEVRIQISPLNRPLSPNYRETSHHMKLLEGRAPQEEYPQSQPAVCVSEDRRSLAVLLCHPHLKTSALAIFQLRTPRTDLSSPYSPIPLPSYCAATSSNDNSSSVFSRDAPVVATHPRFVSIWGISTMCSIPNVSPPILLVACHDGSLVWLDFRSSMAVATGYLTVPDPEKHLPLSSIVAAPTCGINSGTLLALSPEGCMLLVKWQLESTTPMQHALLKRASTGGILLNTPTSNKSPPRRYHSSGGEGGDDGLKQLSPIRIFGRTAGKIDYSRLGLPLFGNSEIEKEESEKRMQHMNQFVLRELQKKTLAGNWMVRKNHHPTKARARRRSDIGLCRNNSMKRSMLVEVLSTLEEPVVDARFGMMPTVVCVVYEATSQTRRVAEIFTISELGSFQPIVALSLAPEQVESAVSVYNHRNDMAARPIERRTSVESRFGVTHDASSDSFAINTMYDNQWIGCVWNWRANVLGWTIQNPVKDFLWSRLYFGNHPHEGCHLAYVETTQNKYIQTRKQVVATGLLSPANTYISALEPCSLLLSFDSVSFPDSSQVRYVVLLAEF